MMSQGIAILSNSVVYRDPVITDQFEKFGIPKMNHISNIRVVKSETERLE